MIRKFNLTNGVSVVITEELAAKYELDNAHSDAAFVGVLAAIVSAQAFNVKPPNEFDLSNEGAEPNLNGGVPLGPINEFVTIACLDKSDPQPDDLGGVIALSFLQEQSYIEGESANEVLSFRNVLIGGCCDADTQIMVIG